MGYELLSPYMLTENEFMMEMYLIDDSGVIYVIDERSRLDENAYKLWKVYISIYYPILLIGYLRQQ
jgi:hypothetical protein